MELQFLTVTCQLVLSNYSGAQRQDCADLIELKSCSQEGWAVHHPCHDQLHICVQQGTKERQHLHSSTVCLQP